MTYRLQLLGPFTLTSPSGAEVPVAGKKQQALVAMAALAGGAPVPRSRLTAVLWGDRGEAQARNSLRQALTMLRKCFDGHGPFPFRITEETLAIDPESLTVDADTLSGRGDAAQPVRGEFLEGIEIPGQPAADWLRAERQRVAGLVADRLAGRLAAADAAGDAQGAVAASRALLEVDPLNETAHRALMRALAASGDRSRALKQFETCRDLLRDELGVEPEAATLRLLEEIRAGAGGAAPAAPESRGAAPAPGTAPTIAVLPFDNLSADPEQEYFSDGITDDIITELGRFRNLNVIARTSAFHFKGRAPLAAEIAETLGADFAVQGSIRKAGNRMRISVQLAETATGRQLWAEHFDRDLADIFAVQDEITGTVAGLVYGRLDMAGQQRALRLAPEKLGAYDLCLRAKALIWKFKPRENLEARALAQRAIALDPQCALAHAQIATTYHLEWLAFWGTERDRALERSYVHAKRAVELDRDDSLARWRLGEVLHYRGEFAESRSQFEAALRLNPNDAESLCMYGYFLSCLAEHEPAMAQFEKATRLDPFDSYAIPWLHGAACYNARRYDDTIALLSRIAEPLAEVYAWLAAANAQLGRTEEAQRQLALFLDAAQSEMPAFPGRRPEDWIVYCSDIGLGLPETAEHFYDGFRKSWPPGDTGG